MEDTLRPLYAREIGVVDEVFAVTHTRLEATRFSCLALADRITLSSNCKVIVATLYLWYSVTEDVMQSLIPAELEAAALHNDQDMASVDGTEVSDDSTALISELNSVLSAYGGDQASAASRRDVDLYSMNSISRVDVKCMRRDVHSRGLTSKIDHRIKTAPPQSRKRNTLLSKSSTHGDAGGARQPQDKNSMYLSDANFAAKRDHIRTLIASRQDIIKKNDEYCESERKLILGEYQHEGSMHLASPFLGATVTIPPMWHR